MKATALKTGLFVAGALLAYNAFAKGTAAQRLTFYPAGVGGLRFDGATPVLTLSLAVQNTSNQTIVLQSLAGQLYANGYLLGNVSVWTPTRINANAESRIPLNVRLSLIGAAQNIVDIIQGGGLAQDIEFEARANVDRYNIPIKIKYRIG